ncbi:hypothetical protein GGTG_03070 [Gaeumannomyces tritici R3-111a-1]|uniref:Uncharacterized protein n=1 Tax=Gaeumannomyces tritici (strain R3-111a-1) TaxID=644352 RepID=J3NP64_GAET3|nr:hypothetical protein GGTG_03070 [Gaeumannomyces tritici R3-111a-1]EJT77967.1 hypothetical protein GGTG_03070 [Gaeumannomyces tritici R3-111a-1]
MFVAERTAGQIPAPGPIAHALSRHLHPCVYASVAKPPTCNERGRSDTWIYAPASQDFGTAWACTGRSLPPALWDQFPPYIKASSKNVPPPNSIASEAII